MSITFRLGLQKHMGGYFHARLCNKNITKTGTPSTKQATPFTTTMDPKSLWTKVHLAPSEDTSDALSP